MPKAQICGVLEALAREQLEERLLLRVGAREAGLDEVDAELVERVRDAQLLVGGQRHALALHAVAEGGVVEVDLPAHVVRSFPSVDGRANAARAR